jgi:opacity protein-like surface antigen
MTRSFLPVLALLLFAIGASAQEPAKVDLFGGYSYTHVPSTTLPPTPAGAPSFASANLNGWNATVEYKPVRWLGAVADFGGSYGTQQVTPGCEVIIPCPPPSFNASARVYSVLFGPRVSVTVGKATPFVHGLVGLAHTRVSGSGSTFSDISHAWAIGGGLDYRLGKGVAWRFQADGLMTNLFAKTQSNFRLSTGIVLRF